MNYKTIKISDHRYNGFCGVGSILENSLIIKVINNEIKENLDITFRRRFIDDEMISITKEVKVLTFNIEISKFLTVIRHLTELDVYLKNKEKGYSMPIFLSTFSVFYDNLEYEIPLDSDISNEIMEITHFSEIKNISNKEISRVTSI